MPVRRRESVAVDLGGTKVAAAIVDTRGIAPPVFVSPNVPGIPADNNMQVFAAYEKALRR